MAAAMAVAAAALAPAPSAPAKQLRPTDLGAHGLVVRGTVATATTFVRVPPGYAIRGGTVDLRFRHSPLLRPDVSTVTVVADGVPLTSARLTRKTAGEGRIRARLPVLPATAGGFTLAARFAMRLTRGDCEDPRNPALWARVLPATRIDARLVPARRSVGAALKLLAPPATGDAIAIRLPAAPSAAELAAAGIVSASLGRADGLIAADPLVQATAAEPAAGTPSIEVAVRSQVAAALERIGAPSRTLARGEGILAVATTGAPRLVVGGADDAGLAKAAEAISTTPLTPSTASIDIIRRAVPHAPRAAQPWRQSAASFEQLGIGTREVAGTALTTLDLPAHRPPSWTLRDGGELDLVLDPGAGLREDTSSLTVDVGGQRVGSRRLPVGDGPAHLRFDLPAGLLNHDLRGRARRSVALRLSFDLQVARGRCVPLDEDVARATVLGTSKLTLPHRTTGDRDLGRFPSPLAGTGRRVSIVVPDTPTPAELTAGLQVAAAVGRWAEPQAPLPRLTRAGDLRTARERNNLVLVGGAGLQLGTRLDVPDGKALRTGEGALALKRSPWSDERAVLLVAGADDDGLTRTASALAQRAVVERLAGSAMRVTPRAALEATATAVPAGQPPVALAPILDEDERFLESLPDYAIPAAVVLVAFLAFVALLVRRRVQAARRT